MSIEGRINVDCLLHDKDGTAAMRVISMASSVDVQSQAYVAAFVTGTLASGQTASLNINSIAYKNAAGQSVVFANADLVAFQWSGEYYRQLSDSNSLSVLTSYGNRPSLSSCDSTDFTISANSGTGTYTIVFVGQT